MIVLPVGIPFKQYDYNASLNWQEKATISVARNILDGAVHLDGMIYLIGGWNDTAQDLVERYDLILTCGRA